jgi:hypothetical protein
VKAVEFTEQNLERWHVVEDGNNDVHVLDVYLERKAWMKKSLVNKGPRETFFARQDVATVSPPLGQGV